MSRRPPATLADYVLVGLNPALIMFLIGSVAFFLLAVFYRGDFNLRVNFIVAMFVMGAVGVCRISMEEGVGYAALFGAPLGLVSLIAMSRFGEFSGTLAAFSPIVNSGIIVLIWWLAYQLTWDCTLLDERADTSDQGLLQAVGLQPDAHAQENIAEEPIDPLLARADESKEELPSWVKWFERGRKPHAHGVWVIYFSLLALPLFGLGQWFLPTDSRSYAFGLLVIYVATALALLMSTSFLGLRRYLRKRRLEMPVEMTASWLGVGGVLIAVVLTLCLLIPRPGAELAVSQLPPITIGTPDRAPSRQSVGNDGQKQDPNARASSTEQVKSPEGAQQGRPGQGSATDSKSKGSASDGQPQSSSGDQPQAGNQSSSPADGKKSSDDPNSQSPVSQPSDGSRPQAAPDGSSSQQEKSSTQQQGEQPQSAASATTKSDTPPSSSGGRSFSPGSLAPSLMTLFKLMLYAAIFLVLAFLGWKYRGKLVAAWQQLLNELRELWARLLGRGPTANAGEEALPAAPARRRFAAYANPFHSGQASQMNRVELLRYTFEALQAWGRENGCEREESETPHEYAQRLAGRQPQMAQEVATLVECYGLAAYAKVALPANITDPLGALWRKMEERTAAVA